MLLLPRSLRRGKLGNDFTAGTRAWADPAQGPAQHDIIKGGAILTGKRRRPLLQRRARRKSRCCRAPCTRERANVKSAQRHLRVHALPCHTSSPPPQLFWTAQLIHSPPPQSHSISPPLRSAQRPSTPGPLAKLISSRAWEWSFSQVTHRQARKCSILHRGNLVRTKKPARERHKTVGWNVSVL